MKAAPRKSSTWPDWVLIFISPLAAWAFWTTDSIGALRFAAICWVLGVASWSVISLAAAHFTAKAGSSNA